MIFLIFDLCAAVMTRSFDGMVIPLSLQADFNLDRSLDSSHGTHGQIVLDDKRNGSFMSKVNLNLISDKKCISTESKNMACLMDFFEEIFCKTSIFIL